MFALDCEFICFGCLLLSFVLVMIVLLFLFEIDLVLVFEVGWWFG